MDTSALSRQFIKVQGLQLKCIPFAGPSRSELRDSLSEHKLLAIGTWNQDLQRHCLSVLDLQVWTHPETGAVQQDAWQELACWACEGRPTDVQVTMQNGNEVTILVATSSGHLSRVVLLIPQHSGATPSDVQVLNEEEFQGNTGDTMGCSPQLHSGGISAADISSGQTQAVTVGADGAVNLVELKDWTCHCFRPASSSRSYYDAAWASRHTFVTAGTTGGLESWDTRQGGTPVHRTPAAWHPDGRPSLPGGLDRQIHCLDIMPERQQECAAGSSGGAVSLWDLRFCRQPILCTANADHGDVVEVKIASRGQDAIPSSSIIYCTNAGILAQVGWPGQAVAEWQKSGFTTIPQQETRKHSSTADVLWQELCGGLGSFDTHAGLHQEIYCITSQEGLLHLRL
ncbi:hypothetical protein WJX74_003440 [Apatococcus lobatus]|uniref:Uncharacterized protein n=1 Tax=Apatococcus lobatus TaxID=904363 RepID=A0AAW1RFJ1_9CHLO